MSRRPACRLLRISGVAILAAVLGVEEAGRKPSTRQRSWEAAISASPIPPAFMRNPFI